MSTAKRTSGCSTADCLNASLCGCATIRSSRTQDAVCDCDSVLMEDAAARLPRGATFSSHGRLRVPCLPHGGRQRGAWLGRANSHLDPQDRLDSGRGSASLFPSCLRRNSRGADGRPEPGSAVRATTKLGGFVQGSDTSTRRAVGHCSARPDGRWRSRPAACSVEVGGDRSGSVRRTPGLPSRLTPVRHDCGERTGWIRARPRHRPGPRERTAGARA